MNNFYDMEEAILYLGYLSYSHQYKEVGAKIADIMTMVLGPIPTSYDYVM